VTDPPTVRHADARQRVYELLHDAGDHGATDRELGLAAGAHIESLRHEGHGIEQRPERDERQRPMTRYWLRKDAWA
jgi:hypothetical protein